jgi:glycosyltransferase involved in cell wall biosynthesis
MVLEAIESIKRQHYSDLEIIVVDDGSTDNTRTEIKSMFPEILQVKLDGVGPGLARNAGADASSGDILMFLDSDDLWLENHARQLLDTMSRGFQVAYGTTKTIDEIGASDFLIPDMGDGIEGDCFEPLLRWCFLVPSSLAVSRKAFMTVGGFDNVDCGEDWTFFLKLSAQFPFGFAGPHPITLRKLHKGSLCFLSDKKKLLAIINQVYTFLENEPRATAAHRDHFTMLHEWTATNMDQWSTVQDWYLEMLKEKII